MTNGSPWASRVVIVMGVAGCGKSTVGRALAERVGARFVEADDYHPAQNVEAMREGRPLDDAMRQPWLEAVCDAARPGAADHLVVLACSALKRRYRDLIRDRLGPVQLVYLAGTPDMMRARLEARRGHFMGVALLGSQFAALEPPGRDERAVEIAAARPVGEIVGEIAELLTASARKSDSIFGKHDV